jgi:hypothetical protein
MHLDDLILAQRVDLEHYANPKCFECNGSGYYTDGIACECTDHKIAKELLITLIEEYEQSFGPKSELL